MVSWVRFNVKSQSPHQWQPRPAYRGQENTLFIMAQILFLVIALEPKYGKKTTKLINLF